MRGYSFVLMSCLLVSWVSAEVPVCLEGQLGGASQAVALSEKGGMVYLGVGPRVVTLDLSEPDTVREIGRSDVLGEVVEDIVVRGGYAYVADGSAGLVILDVSDANALTVVGRWDDPAGGLGRRVSLSGDYAYLADGSWGLKIIDVSNPAQPNRVAALDDLYAHTVAVSDGYAYVGSSSQPMMVLDVSDPMHPEPVVQAESLPHAIAIEVVDGYIYAAGAVDGWQGLSILNAADPPHPVYVGRCEIAYPGELAVAGNFVYATDGWRGIDIIRIANPALPSRVGGYDGVGFAMAVAVSAGQAYIAEDHGGLEVVDVSVPTAPVALAQYATTIFVDVAVSEPYAYVVSTYTGMQVVDVSDPATPAYVSWLDLDYADCVALGKSHVYVGDGVRMVVIDVSDPATSVVTAQCDVARDIQDITVVDRHAYVAAGQGLAVVDVFDPCHPVLVGRCDSSGYARGVCVANDYAYVTGTEGLDIIDIADPAAPVPVGRYAEGEWPFHAAVAGDCAYLARGNSGLQVVDVSDPFLPGAVGSLSTRYARDVVIRGPYGFLLDFYEGLSIIDISAPAFLATVGACDMPGFGDRVVVSGDYAYVACSSGGLAILRIGTPEDTEPTVDK